MKAHRPIDCFFCLFFLVFTRARKKETAQLKEEGLFERMRRRELHNTFGM